MIKLLGVDTRLGYTTTQSRLHSDKQPKTRFFSIHVALPRPQQKGYSLKETPRSAADISFIIYNAKKMPPISLFTTSIYKSTGGSLQRSGKIQSEMMHPDSAVSVPGQTSKNGLSGLIRFQHRLMMLQLFTCV